MKKAVTLADIAKKCGTSNVTVSKALAGKSGVSEALREKIRAAAEEMGYVGVKSSAKTGSAVGVLIPTKFINPNGSFYWALYNALVARLKRENMYCIMENLEQSDENTLLLPRMAEDPNIAAIISLGQLSTDYARLLHENVSDLLLLDYYVPELDVDAVVTNGFSGGYKLASYLVKMGHTRIGFIGSKMATTSIFDRYMGYLKALIENSLPIREDWVIDDRDNRDFITMSFPQDMPTAFVCNCDEAAFHAIKQLRDLGYSVPQDISVVGYDNYLISEICDPTITTINVDSEQMADDAVSTLMERLADPSAPPQVHTIEGGLVVKNSVLPIN